MSDNSESGGRRNVGRSPSYPGLALDKAIERARTLYVKEKMYPTPLMTVMKHWGYTNATGRSGIALSALKKFGLLDEVGKGNGDNRQLQLTRLADDILNNPSAKARRDAIQAAALAPEIHQELWDEFHDELPSDENLEFSLRRNKGFTETGAAEFVREYRDTMQFAGFIGDPHASGLTDDETPDEMPNEMPDERPRERSSFMDQTLDDKAAYERKVALARGEFGIPTSTPVPLPGGGSIVLQAILPISEANWEYFTKVLEVLKPGLVFDAPAAEIESDD